MTVTNSNIDEVVKLLKKEYRRFRTPYVTEVAASGREGARPQAVKIASKRPAREPFKVLVSCVISLRTKDDVTRAASDRLFALASTPDGILRLSRKTIEEAIYPAGFYRTKAANILELSRVIVEEHGSRVPDTIEELMELKGVGRKTANLVVTMGYGKPGICVDTHVHRITNRWGYVKTATPEKTEFALRERLPKKHWIPINDLLVAFGQNVCRPVSPFCSECVLRPYCKRVGVGASR